MKNLFEKIDKEKVFAVVVTLGGALVSLAKLKVDENEKKAERAKLKEEILAELAAPKE